VLVSSFSTTGRDAYWWVAKAKGFYEEVGLDVEVVPGSGTGNNIVATADRPVSDRCGVATALGVRQAPRVSQPTPLPLD
jgi:hypothetical protein